MDTFNDHSEWIAIILAGGCGSRLGELGRIMPKPLLPVSPRETLLSRILDQVTMAGPRRIVVSTSPAHTAMLSASVDLYRNCRQMSDASPVTIELFSNPSHRDGPAPALASALRHAESQMYLLGLSDIFFARNPFICPISNNSFLVTEYEPGREGVVMTHYGQVTRIIKAPHHTTSPAGEGVFNWTGAATFDASTRDGLIRRSAGCVSQPLERVFDAVLADSVPFSTRPAGPFVNVNEFQNLLECQRLAEAEMRVRSAARG